MPPLEGSKSWNKQRSRSQRPSCWMSEESECPCFFWLECSQSHKLFTTPQDPFFVNDGSLNKIECGAGPTFIWQPHASVLCIPLLHSQLREAPTAHLIVVQLLTILPIIVWPKFAIKKKQQRQPSKNKNEIERPYDSSLKG